MGLTESQEQIQSDVIPSTKRTNSWRITSIDLNQKMIIINKVKYIIGNNELGRGAFGRVYPARRLHDGVEVAIKVISLAESSSMLPSLAESFLNEINQSNKLSSQSKHVVKMFDFDFHRNGLAFIVMERGGLDLEKSLINKATLPIPQQKRIWKEILNILITLHKHSLVHVDLKPSNLVFFGDRLKLVDLGIAQNANSRGHGPNGTYGFSAPEVHMTPYDGVSRYTHKADVWSAGAILYWINYGNCPKYDHKDVCYRPPSNVPISKDRNLIEIFRHTLRMDPHHRADTNWLAHHSFTRSH